MLDGGETADAPRAFVGAASRSPSMSGFGGKAVMMVALAEARV
jgi:hypothetical protein